MLENKSPQAKPPEMGKLTSWKFNIFTQSEPFVNNDHRIWFRNLITKRKGLCCSTGHRNVADLEIIENIQAVRSSFSCKSRLLVLCIGDERLQDPAEFTTDLDFVLAFNIAVIASHCASHCAPGGCRAISVHQ